ncbi:hypothetical protein BDN72DRAFT_847331 [Pluteus cervinus]|uniref:Uncharacterized protein n=1 Tax=Pluteus cervinus TaxID=181527 RepID=A0ACD3AD76_9AGAR|nr:hypothetical protein BDN72DRAFT_847331 [Pluteus cervinus]
MDVLAASLPPELWMRIFDFLSPEDIQVLLLVHRVFRPFCAAQVWRTIKLCTLERKDFEKAQAIIRDPNLGQMVNHLVLNPAEWFDYTFTQMDLQSLEVPMWAVALKSFDLAHPIHSIHSIRRFGQSRRIMAIANKVLPLLTNLQEITLPISTFLRQKPSADPYYALLARLRAPNVRLLFLQVHTFANFRIFCKAIGNPMIVFESLEQLILSVDVSRGRDDYAELADDVRAVANCGRNSLLGLGLLFDFRSASLLAKFASGLGFFPKLAHLHLTSSTPFFQQQRAIFQQHLGSFIAKHHNTLRRLRMPAICLDHLVLDQMFADSRSLELTGLNIPFRYILSPDGPAHMPDFRRYSGTLTTLMLSSPTGCRSRGLTFGEVVAIITSLSRPSHGILLRRLMLKVVHLSPDLFDFFASHLENLHTLEVEYGSLLGDEESMTILKLPFRTQMRRRRYPTWRLRSIYIYPTDVSESGIMQLLAECIPSVRERGPIDWSDVRLEQLNVHG